MAMPLLTAGTPCGRGAEARFTRLHSRATDNVATARISEPASPDHRAHGSSWTFVNPYTLLPRPGIDFCCDQVVLYDSSRNLFFWLLQHLRDDHGNKVLRLA